MLPHRPRAFFAGALAGVAVLVTLLVGAALVADRTGSDFILIEPAPAAALAPVVQIDGEAPDPTSGQGVYYVAVLERQASQLDRVLARFDDDAELLRDPHSEDTEVQRDAVSRSQMSNSQMVAAAVAERKIGLPVRVDRDGVRITAVSPGTPADQAGLLAGDVIRQIDGHDVRSLDALRRALRAYDPGERVPIRIRRDDRERTITSGTTRDPDDASRPVLGILAEDDGRITLGREVTYRLSNVGGPSAGLAFAVEIYESLSERRLTSDRRVAITGELDLSGAVQPVGGVAQKAIGAARAGVELFIVPADNAAEARAAAHGRLDVVGVATFDQALAALRGAAD